MDHDTHYKRLQWNDKKRSPAIKVQNNRSAEVSADLQSSESAGRSILSFSQRCNVPMHRPRSLLHCTCVRAGLTVRDLHSTVIKKGKRAARRALGELNTPPPTTQSRTYVRPDCHTWFRDDIVIYFLLTILKKFEKFIIKISAFGSSEQILIFS